MHEILISTGSNIDKEANTQAAFDALYECFGEIKVSRVFESQSIGFEADSFFNAVVYAQTSQSLEQVCEHLKQIEIANGRIKQAEKFSSRTLDLDLLTFDGLICEQPLVLPRAEILYNAFVLQPLAELVPDYSHPIVGKSYRQLWQEYDQSSQKLWATDFTWDKRQR